MPPSPSPNPSKALAPLAPPNRAPPPKSAPPPRALFCRALSSAHTTVVPSLITQQAPRSLHPFFLPPPQITLANGTCSVRPHPSSALIKTRGPARHPPPHRSSACMSSEQRTRRPPFSLLPPDDPTLPRPTRPPPTTLCHARCTAVRTRQPPLARRLSFNKNAAQEQECDDAPPIELLSGSTYSPNLISSSPLSLLTFFPALCCCLIIVDWTAKITDFLDCWTAANFLFGDEDDEGGSGPCRLGRADVCSAVVGASASFWVGRARPAEGKGGGGRCVGRPWLGGGAAATYRLCCASRAPTWQRKRRARRRLRAKLSAVVTRGSNRPPIANEASIRGFPPLHK